MWPFKRKRRIAKFVAKPTFLGTVQGPLYTEELGPDGKPIPDGMSLFHVTLYNDATKELVNIEVQHLGPLRDALKQETIGKKWEVVFREV